jgi:hypothetical protein
LPGIIRPTKRDLEETCSDALTTESGGDDESIDFGNHCRFDDRRTTGLTKEHVDDARDGAIRCGGQEHGVVGFRYVRFEESSQGRTVDLTKQPRQSIAMQVVAVLEKGHDGT